MWPNYREARWTVAFVVGVWAVTGGAVFPLLAWFAAVFYLFFALMRPRLRNSLAVVLFVAVLLDLYPVAVVAAVLLLMQSVALREELPPAPPPSEGR